MTSPVDVVIAIAYPDGLLQVTSAREVLSHVESHSTNGHPSTYVTGGTTLRFFDKDAAELSLVRDGSEPPHFEPSGKTADVVRVRSQIHEMLAQRAALAEKDGGSISLPAQQNWSDFLASCADMYRFGVGVTSPPPLTAEDSRGWFHNLIYHRGRP